MQIETAKTAAGLASQIEAVQGLIAMINVALAEHWPLTVMKASAPATGASYPGGTPIDLLPAGPASDANSQLGLQQALSTYQAELDALNAQLAAL